MKLKSPRPIPAWVTGVFCAAAPTAASAALAIVNGNFENTTGLSNLGGGWYGGVSAGWSGPSNNYSVGSIGSGSGVTSVTSNLENSARTSPTFSPLYQDIGVLDTESTITLSFDFSRPWNGVGNLGVAIWPGAVFGSDLASANISTIGTQTLTVANVPAGTAIRIGFWRSSPTGAPGLDNVSISVTPVPEPSSLAIAGLGASALLMTRRRHIESKRSDRP
ncbi:MAG: PEP-CTERM sorting domain-containing protein [Verrucomicrobiota bacterium]